jgi:hypothetical protein
MARELDTFDFGDRVSPTKPKYDWTRWLKGDPWEIRKDEDYDISTENMRVTLHSKADQKKLKVRTAKVPRLGEPGHGEWEGLVFQFYEPDEDDV